MRVGLWTSGWAGLFAAVSLAAAPAVPRVPASDETPVYSGAEETAAGTRHHAPAVSYWRVRLRLQAGEHAAPVHVGAFVPTSDGRQTVVSRQSTAAGFAVRETLLPPNLRIDWDAPHSGGGDIAHESLVRISAVEHTLPATPITALPKPSDPSALTETPVIQSRAADVLSLARRIVGTATRTDESVWALYEYVAAFQPPTGAAGPQDAATVLRTHQGNSLGRARALVALLRASGISARPVGGLRLGSDMHRKATFAWVECWTGDEWVPLDPVGGHYASLPENYLALYHGDLPLIVHSVGIAFDYAYVIRETTRRAAEDDLLAPTGAEDVTPRTSFVAAPAGTVVMLTDEDIPAAVSERILAEARTASIDCVLLSAPFESRYFRQTHLERLLAAHDGAVRRANLIVIATTDDVGALALLSIAGRGVRLPDTRVVIAGAIPQPAAMLFARLNYRLLHPGELLLVSHPANLFSLWGLARANLLDGVPLQAEAPRWDLAGVVLGDPALVVPSWRPRLVRAWEFLVRAQVPLAPITLILSLPIIATVVVAARVLIGLQTFGNFGPMIVALAFVTTGLRWGTVLFVAIVGLGVLLRVGLQRLRLQAVARLAILMTLVAVVMAALTFFGASTGNAPLLQVSVFPMIIMANVIEHFGASQAELGTGQALRMTASTLGLAILCYLLIDRTGLPALLLAMPELLLLTVLLDVLLGRFRGVRLLEYGRFASTIAREGRQP